MTTREQGIRTNKNHKMTEMKVNLKPCEHIHVPLWSDFISAPVVFSLQVELLCALFWCFTGERKVSAAVSAAAVDSC